MWDKQSRLIVLFSSVGPEVPESFLNGPNISSSMQSSTTTACVWLCGYFGHCKWLVIFYLHMQNHLSSALQSASPPINSAGRKPERSAECINASSLHHHIPVCLWANLKAHKRLRHESFMAAWIADYINAVVVLLQMTYVN